MRLVKVICFMLAFWVADTPVRCQSGDSRTVALWLFDEQEGIYPSCVLSDQSPNDYPMVIGPGGQIVAGKFGNALEPLEQPPVEYPPGEIRFGLAAVEKAPGRTVEPLTWMNANFCALMTSGENHLRKEVGFPQSTLTKLNLGAFDWTVEFWYLPTRTSGEAGVVFEIGSGPRGENEKLTRLALSADQRTFTLLNQAGGVRLEIPSNRQAFDPSRGAWHHLAFVYTAAEQQLRHYLDGVLQPLPDKAAFQSLESGEEDYFSVGRDGLWKRPLPGRIDELCFSSGRVYRDNFQPPGSFAPQYPPRELIKGPPLLFEEDAGAEAVLELGSRKHLFVDDAIVAEAQHLTFTVNPPRLEECVIDSIEGPFRKHLSIVEDEQGVIRLYNSIHDDFLAVRLSRDGVHWEIPDLGRGEYRGQRNIVIHQPVGGLGNPFLDPNGPAERKWNYITGYHRRAIFLYTSADGYTWDRHKTAVLPFRSGTQSCTFYDDQRQLYVGYHRTGIAKTPAGATQRESVVTEVKDLYSTWPFRRVSQEETPAGRDRQQRLRDPLPWYLDNGPLTPGGFGLEYLHRFTPIDSLDPVGIDIYITKAIKYPWAPDTYLAFPIVYFHYEKDGPLTRQILMDPRRERGSGPVETQLSVSRDGINWKRYPRPAYIGNGRHGDFHINQAYIAHGMIKRGDEIWQYYFGTEYYHSAWKKIPYGEGVFRVVQRFDGFVSVDSPYHRHGLLKTRPLRFSGNRLLLNIDTGAAGYAQVGFLDENGRAIEGFSVDDCVYINGDFIETEVEWLGRGKDLLALQGRTVQVVFRMRGSKLYSMQFTSRE